MPNSQTLSGLDLPYDVEWTLDYGTRSFDSFKVKFGDIVNKATGSWGSSGNNPRIEQLSLLRTRWTQSSIFVIKILIMASCRSEGGSVIWNADIVIGSPSSMAVE